MNKLKDLLNKILNPTLLVYVFTYIFSVIFIIGAIVCLFFDYNANPIITIVSYSLFALSGIGLTYSTYLIIKSRKLFKQKFIKICNYFTITRFLLEHYGYRKFVFMIWSFSLSIAYSVINFFLGFSLPSIWYCSLAGYNLFLVLMRGSILLYHNNRRKDKRRTIEQDKLSQARTYLTCGILLLVLNVALSIAISEVIFHNQHYNYYSWTIYAFAAFTFYKITMAIIRLIRGRNNKDLTERAAYGFNLATACFSVMGLQTALLSTFGNKTVNTSLFNTLTGSFVSAVTITLGVIMVVNASINIKNIKSDIKK